jgi:DNA-binding CsgD family transcriptional regulator
MQIIPVPDLHDRSGAVPGHGSAEAALAGLVGCIGTDAFGTQGLLQMNGWLPAAWWAVYRIFDDAPPTLHALGSVGVTDRTRQSWQVYRDSLYRFDESFQAARSHLANNRIALLHRHSSEIPMRHRAEIYSRNGLRERLSIVTERSGTGLLAINLFRHVSQPAFSDQEIDHVRCVSPLVLACVERHVDLHRQTQPGAGILERLPPRERAVCERLLKGWTHEGIAADLGISAGTVKTYRNRAFDKLGIHHRNELFALAISELGSSS